jgi:hypothetical protein
MPGVSVEKACGHETPEKFCSGVGVCLILLGGRSEPPLVNASPATAASIIRWVPNPQGSCMTVMCSPEHLFELAPVDVVTPRRPRDAGGNVMFVRSLC